MSDVIEISKNKVWFYRTFGGGKGRGLSKDHARNEIAAQKLGPLVQMAIRPDRKKTPEQRRDSLLKVTQAGINAADRAVTNGQTALAVGMIQDLKTALTSPLTRPPPDDRLDSELTQQERDQRDTRREQQIIERRKLVADTRSLIVAALINARQGSPEETQLQQLKEDLDRELAMGFVDVGDPFRAKLYEDKVSETVQHLLPKINRDVAPEHREKATTKLGNKVAEIIDQMVSEAVFKYLNDDPPGGLGATKTGTREGRPYASVMTDLLQNGGQALHQRFPGLQERIDLETTQFQANMAELMDRVHADKGELEQDMFGGQAMKGLKGITVADSDPHNGGHRVTILTFEGTDGQEYRVVNKPRDIRVDAKFVGSTGQNGNGASLSERTTQKLREKEAKRLQKEQTALQLGALLQNLTNNTPDYLESIAADFTEDMLTSLALPNDQAEVVRLKRLFDNPTVENAHMVTATNTVPALPTYKFIDKQAGGGHRYGYVEFIEHGRPEDCVLDDDGCKNFYQQSGQLAALSFLCGVEDVHQGNIMIRDGQPVLTDLEIAFSSKQQPDNFDPVNGNAQVIGKYIGDKLTTTMFDKGMLGGDQIAHDSNGKVQGDVIERRDVPFGGRKELTENSVFLDLGNGQLKSQTEGLAGDYSDEFKSGFESIVNLFGDPNDENDNSGYIDSFTGMDVRFHALATREQLSTRRTQMQNGYTTTIAQTSIDTKTSLRNGIMSNRIQDNPWQDQLIDSMGDDLASRDVAYYTQTLGTQSVKHNGVNPIQHNGSIALLETDGLDIAKQNLKLMIHKKQLVLDKVDEMTRQFGNNRGSTTEMTELKQKMLNG